MKLFRELKIPHFKFLSAKSLSSRFSNQPNRNFSANQPPPDPNRWFFIPLSDKIQFIFCLMMRFSLMLLFALAIKVLLFSQVAVNSDGSQPDNSAILDIKSNTKGFLPPRMTHSELNAIPDPANGLLVYCTDCGSNGSGAISVYMNDNWYTLNVSSNCGSSVTVNHIAGDVAPVNKSVTYGIVTNIPGEPSKCWLNSNLGASHQATAAGDTTEASAGWYWQFNHKQGYKHNASTRIPNTIWINPITENTDWQNANDPCLLELGNGWRIPTTSEWNNVNVSGAWSNWDDPWLSDLKIHTSGYLSSSNGMLYGRGANGFYWSSSQYNSNLAWYLRFPTESNNIVYYSKALGASIRCLTN
jgi:uncharacterized protein (TIGR02145 family)